MVLVPVGGGANGVIADEGFDMLGADDGFDAIGRRQEPDQSTQHRKAEKIVQTASGLGDLSFKTGSLQYRICAGQCNIARALLPPFLSFQHIP